MPSVKKLNRKKSTTIFGTWNLNGKLRELYRQEELFEDMKSQRVSFAALQETMWDQNVAVNGTNGEMIINFSSQEDGYRGLGFYISSEWKERLVTSKIVNGRMAVLRFRAFSETGKEGKADLVIINVYAPTMMRAKAHPEITESFYHELEQLYQAEKKGTTSVFITGDFNSKIGKLRAEDGKFMGKFGKGERNENGDILQHFLEENGLYLVNTHFNHRDRQIATWHKSRPPGAGTSKKERGVHNQIDYIVVPRHMIKLFTDAKATAPMRYRTDHSLVIGKINFKALYKLRRVKREQETKRNLNALVHTDLTKDFRNVVSGRLKHETETNPEMTVKERYELIKSTLKKSADETLPRAPVRTNGKIKYLDDERINSLSKKQLKLTKQIYHSRGKINQEKKKKLRKRRGKIFKKIRERIKVLNEERIEELANEMENSKGNRKVFEVARILTKNQDTAFSLYDKNSDRIYETAVMMREITKFYSGFFAREGATPIPQWRGEPRALKEIITGEEVTLAAKKLRNHRALGPDDIAGELIKYGGEEMHAELAITFNGIFEKHEAIEELKEGYLYALNKPGKTRTAENTRPLVFLSITRKVLSSIVLHRISGKADEFLSLSQHAYRAHRSTTEVAMTAQWLSATSEKYAERIHIMGIDLSKAFDCIDRSILMQILEENKIATEDELRLIQYLISETKLRVKIGKTYGEKFSTIIGTPQGDALSPLLFLIYLEKIIRTANLEEYLTKRDIMYAYADDVNFAILEADEKRTEGHSKQKKYEAIEGCPCAACRAYGLESYLPQHFAKYHMQMNVGKTTHVEFTAGNSTEVQLSTVGNSVSGKHECKARIQSANSAFNSMQRIWLRRASISIETKMKLYNSCVQSRLLYNAGASAYTRVELDKLDAAHRRHLRRLLGVFYPEHISNEETYTRTRTRPISIDITKKRWTLLGHTLRLSKETPGNRVITQYFQRKVMGADEKRKSTRRGRVLTTLPRLLQRDFRERLTENERRIYFNVTELDNGRHLSILRARAESRDHWRDGVAAIVKKEHRQWTKRNTAKKEKRAAEKKKL
jgi:exonuclease III